MLSIIPFSGYVRNCVWTFSQIFFVIKYFLCVILHFVSLSALHLCHMNNIGNLHSRFLHCHSQLVQLLHLLQL